MIVFSDVSKSYLGKKDALKQVGLRIERGEMCFITGRSGAGKSTLLRLVGLLEVATRGQIVVDGQNLGRLKRSQTPSYRRKIGFVFQDHKLLPERSVFDNVALPLVIKGVNRHEIGRRVRAALDKVGLLHKERGYPSALSSGEQQRVGIARAVVHRPPIVLADEPTGNLDPELSLEIMHLFEQFNRVGVTVLIATHEVGLVRQLGHRVITLQDGHLVGTNSGPMGADNAFENSDAGV